MVVLWVGRLPGLLYKDNNDLSLAVCGMGAHTMYSMVNTLPPANVYVYVLQ